MGCQSPCFILILLASLDPVPHFLLEISAPVSIQVEKEMATHSSVLAWRIPGMGEPGGLLSMGSHGVGHDWSDLAAAAAAAATLSQVPSISLASLSILYRFLFLFHTWEDQGSVWGPPLFEEHSTPLGLLTLWVFNAMDIMMTQFFFSHTVISPIICRLKLYLYKWYQHLNT